MVELTIEQTKNTLGVLLDPVRSYLKFWGDSTPEDAKYFFCPIFDWIDQYIYNLPYLIYELPNYLVTLEFDLTSANSSTIAHIKDIIFKVSGNVKVQVDWVYAKDDLDMLELGKDLQELLDVEFVYKNKYL